MLFPFGARSPISTAEQAWLDDRADRLLESIGQRRLLEMTTVQPSHPVFALDDRREIFNEIAGLLDMDARDDVVIFRDQPPPTQTAQLLDLEPELFHATDERRNIVVPTAHAANGFQVAAMSARVAAHCLVLERQLATCDDPDLGYLADLVTVFFGLGICTANTALQETAWGSVAYGDNMLWNMQRYGHMTMPMFGYALGWFANKRQEPQPDWVKALRPDVRRAFKMTIRYLRS